MRAVVATLDDTLGAHLVQSLDHLDGDMGAMLHAFERYQGAAQADSDRYVHMQARALSDEAFDVLGDTRQSICARTCGWRPVTTTAVGGQPRWR